MNFRDLAHEFSFFIIYFFSLLGWHGGDYGTKDIQVLHYGIWPWRSILNELCISISNLPENIDWQTHKDELRPEARGPLKSGAWGGRPTCDPQTPAMSVVPHAPYSPYFAPADFTWFPYLKPLWKYVVSKLLSFCHPTNSLFTFSVQQM
jgi:hypothetical protein